MVCCVSWVCVCVRVCVEVCWGVWHPTVDVGGGSGGANVAISSTFLPLHLLSFLHEHIGHEGENGESPLNSDNLHTRRQLLYYR